MLSASTFEPYFNRSWKLPDIEASNCELECPLFKSGLDGDERECLLRVRSGHRKLIRDVHFGHLLHAELVLLNGPRGEGIIGPSKARVHLAEIYSSSGRAGDAEALLIPAISSGDPEVRWRLFAGHSSARRAMAGIKQGSEFVIGNAALYPCTFFSTIKLNTRSVTGQIATQIPNRSA